MYGHPDKCDNDCGNFTKNKSFFCGFECEKDYWLNKVYKIKEE